MKYSQFRYLVLSDLYRITRDIKLRTLFKGIVFNNSYRFTFLMRTCGYTNSKFISKYTIYPFILLYFRHITFKLGISIPWNTQIGPGFYIGHFGGIVINENCVIGRNCNISQGVTLGQKNRGAYKGYPTVGDNVYIGPGAKIIGAVKVGNNVAIGANCVVTKDIPDNSVVVGIPGRVISQDGSLGYVGRTDYDSAIN